MKMKIKQPQGQIIIDKNGHSKLIWKKDFKDKWQSKIDNAQKYVDSSCIRLMDKYTPMLSGMLIKSATLGTKIGEGEIHQIAPYAKYQYYGKLMVSSKTASAWSKGEKKILTDKDLNYTKAMHPLAGPFWFERMKRDHLAAILKGAQEYAERG